jgi:hypothetical protein
MFPQDSLYNQHLKIGARMSLVVHPDLEKTGSSRKVNFPASRKCLRIRALLTPDGYTIYTPWLLL